MTQLAPIGGLAAILASLSYVPQVSKAWPRGSSGELSLTMLMALTRGLGLWVVYGIILGDRVIITANLVGNSLAGTILICKLCDCTAA